VQLSECLYERQRLPNDRVGMASPSWKMAVQDRWKISSLSLADPSLHPQITS
jgi:hypothetical protein